jgi:WD40 repeat protein
VASAETVADLKGHLARINGTSFSPDGARIVTASADNTARVWDATTGEQMAVLTGHEGPVTKATFSPNGRRIVTAGADKTVRIWDAVAGNEVSILEGDDGKATDVRFTSDGLRVVTMSFDRNTSTWTKSKKIDHVWDVASGRSIVVVETLAIFGPDEPIVFSPDEQRIVTVAGDKTVRVLDATNGREIAILRGHEGRIGSARFSADGSRIVTTSEDETARIWDTRSGAEIAVLKGHTAAVKSASFSPEGERIVTTSEDHTVRLWDAASGAEIVALTGDSARFSQHAESVLAVHYLGKAGEAAELWDVRLVSGIRGQALVALVCREKLTGAEAFSLKDAENPIFAGLENTRPCDRVGPLAPHYWADVTRGLWRRLTGVTVTVPQ